MSFEISSESSFPNSSFILSSDFKGKPLIRLGIVELQDFFLRERWKDVFLRNGALSGR